MQKTEAIGEIFLRLGLIKRDQLNQALERQKLLKRQEALGDVLVSMGFISEKDRVRGLGEQWGVPFVDLQEAEIDPAVIKLVPESVARKLKVLPVARKNGRLTIAMKNPLDIFAIDEVRLMTGTDVEPGIALEEEIITAIARLYRTQINVSEQVDSVIKEFDTGEIDFDAGSDEGDDEDISIEQLRELSEEAPVIKLANLIVSRGISDGGSDIHIEPAKDYVRVRLRVDGVLNEIMRVPKKVQSSLVSRFKIMAEMDIATKRSPQDGRIGAVIDGKQFDFRVSTLPSVFGEKIVLRILDKSSVSVGLHKLGMLPETMEKFEGLISRTYGIILVTGPTGSGKSTTLYSVLSKLNSGEKNILTIEDPVEYELEGLTQVQINNRAGLTFPAGLRTMLRQDPDIAMVGEIRDAETAIIATEAALTGHLVLSTLHTNDAPGAMTRLVEMGIEPFLIASSVIGVLAQRLVRVVCPKCKEQYTPPRDAVGRLGIELDSDTKITFYRGRGCDFCRGTGYKGRLGVYELMVVTDRVRDLVLQKSSAHVLREAAMDSGMKTLKDDAVAKILLGQTTLEECLRVIYAG
ncbi:MAG: type II/IV secretion system protein [Armatimonadetes bacterium]|jgi:type IV pilus assembly protein PilB|nr:type II/IV secretion system protein [Armatimonadota bacterium]